MKKNRKITIICLLILLHIIFPDFTGSEAQSSPAAKTTVILIRHVERDNFFVVTREGHERARALVDAVGEMGISAIYSPDLERNLDTVKPLADRLKIEISITPRFTRQTINKLVGEILAGHSGEVVLLVGNGSANLRLLHQRLGGTGEGPYSYGDLFIYTIVENGRVEVNKSRFGK